MSQFQAIKGTTDILPGEVETWQRIEQTIQAVMRLYGYHELRVPIFEETGLFARSIGEDTDIVGKEMYTFRDMGERSITLRPEGTASVVRAFIEHSLDQRGLPQKLWYIGPMFRQERPQKGRQRQFHQFGVEALGSSDPGIDAEIIMLFDSICDKLGLDKRVFLLNSLGGAASREAYRAVLAGFLDTIEGALCDDCKRRKRTNPLRVLDCKVPSCIEALHKSGKLPRTIDYLTDRDRNDFESIQRCLHDGGIAFSFDFSLVRGLDYYTGTVFEVQYEGLGAQSAIMGGGRYDTLVEQLGGPATPAVGFACGIERLILAMQEAGSIDSTQQAVDVYFITVDAHTHDRVMRYLRAVRARGIAADCDYAGRSVKAQMKAAARYGARYAVIVEPEGDAVSVRDMEQSEQQTMSFDEFIHTMTT